MSMFPHSVTIYTITEDVETAEVSTNITVVRGVLYDGTKAANVNASGLVSADAVNLYIPFDAKCIDGTTETPKSYIPPQRYKALLDKTGFWTMDPESTFFVLGEIVNPDMPFQEINRRYDAVHRITKVDLKDFGGLPHFEVGGQ